MATGKLRERTGEMLRSLRRQADQPGRTGSRRPATGKVGLVRNRMRERSR